MAVEEPFHQGGGGERADADFEPVRHGDAVEFEVLHFPQVADHVLGAAGGTGFAVHLHGVARGGESEEDRADVGRVGDPFAQVLLHQVPHVGADRLDPELVGDHPVGAARDLRGEVGITGRGHRSGRGFQDVSVGGDRERREAGQRLLQAVVGHGRAVGRVAVHGACGRDAEVTVARDRRGAFHEVVDRTAADRDRHAVERHGVGQARGQGVVRVDHRHGRENERLVRVESGGFQDVEQSGPGGLPGVFIGHDPGAARLETAADQLRHVAQRAGIHHEGLGLHSGRDRQ